MIRMGLTAAIVLVAGQLASAAASAPKAPSVDLVEQAVAALKAGQDAQAESDALRAIEAGDTRLAQAWLVVGLARQRAGRADGAAQAFQTVLASRPNAQTAGMARRELDKDRPNEEPPAALSPSDQLRLSRVEADRASFESSHVLVEAPNFALAERIASLAETELSLLWKRFLPDRPDLPARVEIQVWPDDKTYRQQAPHAPQQSAGCMIETVDAVGLPIARIDLRQNAPDGELTRGLLDQVLPHELCHAVLRNHLAGGTDRCPLAIHEGLAMLSEHAPDNSRVRLAGAALAGTAPGRIALVDLLAVTAPEDVDAAVFYAESYSFVEFLHGRLTERQFSDFLACLARGMTVPAALQQALLLAPSEEFLSRLAITWESYSILQAQLTEALSATPTPPTARQ